MSVSRSGFFGVQLKYDTFLPKPPPVLPKDHGLRVCFPLLPPSHRAKYQACHFSLIYFEIAFLELRVPHIEGISPANLHIHVTKGDKRAVFGGTFSRVHSTILTNANTGQARAWPRDTGGRGPHPPASAL